MINFYRKVCLLILIVSQFIGCKNNKHSQNLFELEPLYKVSFSLENDVVTDPTDFFSLFDSIKLIPLMTNADYLIGAVDKIILNQNHIFLSDPVSKSLFKYSCEGEPIFKIHNIGKGPEEYVKLTDFDLIGDTLVIFDGHAGSILKYSKDGKFLSKAQLRETTGAKIGIINNENIVVFNQGLGGTLSFDNVAIVDLKGKVINSYMPAPDWSKNNAYSKSKPLDYYQDNLLYLDNYLPYVYSITRDSINFRYAIDFGDNNITTEFLQDRNDKDVSEILMDANNNNKAFAFDFFCETAELISFIFIHRGKTYMGFHRKNSNQSYLVNSGDLKADFASWFVRPFLSSDDSILISGSSVLALKDIVQHIPEVQKHLFLPGFDKIESLGENDNPCLVIYYPKK